MYSPSSCVWDPIQHMTNKTQQRASKGKNKSTKKSQLQRRQPMYAVPSNYTQLLSPPGYELSSKLGGLEIHVRGRDILGTLQYPGGTSKIFGVFDLNPACWNNSRLSLLARSYEKYRFDSFVIKTVPSVATSTAGMLAIYVEPEVYDSVANTLPGALTHHDSTAGPVWMPQAVKFTRAPSDQTTYLCTEKSGIERGLLTQAKAAIIADTGATNIGLATIEYDITFMYPELEFGYSGTQYESTTAAFTAAANGTIATVPTWTSNNIKVVECIASNDVLNLFINNVSNVYNIVAGNIFYSAWDGTTWRIYPDIASALAKSAPVSSVAALVALNVSYYLRRLVIDG